MSGSTEPIREQIIGLGLLERPVLIELWIKAYGVPSFKGARKATLIRGLAYHIQCKHQGGLKPSLNRKLLKIAKSSTANISSATKKPAGPKTKFGTQLVREWNGRTHTVHVTDKGYVMAGVTYGSLSAAAKAITGAHWSGPRFFGVAS